MEQDRDASLPESQRDATLSRRSWLRGIGWSLVAAALPRGTGFAAETISPVMAKLSAYMSEARNRPLPDEVIEKAKHHILDTLAAMISGSELPPGLAALQFVREFASPST